MKQIWRQICVFVSAGFCATAPLDLAAEALRPDVTYQGGTVVALDAQGVSVTVPEGWQGALSGDYFVISRSDTQNILAVILEEATPAEIEAFLAAPQELPGSVYYQPTGAGQWDGDHYTVTAQVTDWERRVPAEVFAKTSPFGWAIGVFAVIVDETARAETVAAATNLLGNAALGKPILPEPGEFSGPWVSTLVNKTLTHRSSTGTTWDHFSFTFCDDGSFAFYSSQSGASQTDFYDGSSVSTSHLGVGNSSGQWAVSGDTVYLWYEDGKQAAKLLSKNDKGNIFFDGTRYYRGGEACG